MIDLHTIPTANGQRGSVVLEEVGLPYNVHAIDFTSAEHLAPDFLAINPLGMAPAMIDHDGSGGESVNLFETLAICYCLAEKIGKLMLANRVARVEAHKWAVTVAANSGPAFAGQYYFKLQAETPVACGVGLYETRSKRFLRAMDGRLAENEFLAGDTFTIADVMAYPSAATSGARLDDGIAAFSNVVRWANSLGNRPAVKKGMAVPA